MMLHDAYVGAVNGVTKTDQMKVGGGRKESQFVHSYVAHSLDAKSVYFTRIMFK